MISKHLPKRGVRVAAIRDILRHREEPFEPPFEEIHPAPGGGYSLENRF